MITLFAATIILGLILTALTRRSRRLCGTIGVGTVTIMSGILFCVAYRVFTGGPRNLSKPLMVIPSLGAELTVSVDYLSALFLVIIGLVSFAGTLYSFRYMDLYPSQGIARFYHCLILFIAGMVGVVSVSDMFFFFVFWEFMTLTSYFLVIYEKEDQVVLRAGLKYFIMTHVGTAAMFIGAILLQTRVGSFAFAALREALSGMVEAHPVQLSFVLGLFVLGFGTKAGMYPVGGWLPDAHPAAPSGVSAMLSGVMIKMGVYGFVRFFFFLLPVSTHTFAWGIVIAACGAVSLFMGTVSALLQHDFKRLLAFSSIGQMGYILLGIGTGLAFYEINPLLSVVATMAGMYHLVNHAVFKGLLFLNAGAILYKTGTRDLNRLSGLYSVMPLTAWVTLIAALSIAGMPPFNGFVSKWLIYQTTIIGGISVPVFILFGVVAIFISTVTIAYFIKFFGTCFGGEMGSELETSLRPGLDVPYTMRIPQNIFALLCVLLGLFPWIPLQMIHAGLTGSLYGNSLPHLSSVFGMSEIGLIPMMGGVQAGVWFPLMGLLVFGGCLMVAVIISRVGSPESRSVPIWNCGEVYDTDEVRYRAQSFYLPLASHFERLVSWEAPPIHLKKPERIYRGIDFDKVLFYPLVTAMLRFSEMFRRTHVGIPQVYMLFQVIGFILVVAVIVWLTLM